MFLWKKKRKLIEFADDNFESYENGGNLFKRVENTVVKGEIARYVKTCTADT